MSIKATLTLVLMIALLPIVGNAQVTHVVTQVGTSFSPANITIETGDTVRWEWTSGIHTVTPLPSSSSPSRRQAWPPISAYLTRPSG